MKDESVTIAKGIGIILMVIGHSGLDGYPTRLIYMFHMPLFFFLSGFCFKKSYIFAPRKFIMRRIKSIYVPFVKYSLLFLVLHNVFVIFYIYDNMLSLKETLVKIAHIVLSLWSGEPLLGGFWFLKSLFWGSILFYIVQYITKFKQKYIYNGGVILLCLGLLCNWFKFKIPVIGINDTDIIASLFMLIGSAFKNRSVEFSKKLIIASVVLLFIGAFFWYQQMIYLKYKIMVPYVITGVIGSFITLIFSRKIQKLGGYFSKTLVFIGNNSLHILIWHFLSFKFVTFFIVILFNLSITSMTTFPVLNEYASQGWWLLYVIVGIAFPLVLVNIKSLIFKKHFYEV